MENLNNKKGIEELSNKELSEINGGETLWYWALYVVGSGGRFIIGAIENPPNLPSASLYK